MDHSIAMWWWIGGFFVGFGSGVAVTIIVGAMIASQKRQRAAAATSEPPAPITAPPPSPPAAPKPVPPAAPEPVLAAETQPIFIQIVEIIAEECKIDPIDIRMHSDLRDDLGIDSLKKIELTMIFEEHFHLDTIPDEEAENMETVGDIFVYLVDHGVLLT